MDKIHNKKSIRLKGYDYSRAGLYFITICCQNRECRLGIISDQKMILNEYGDIANNELEKLPKRFPNIELDVLQIMPNHIHFIFLIKDKSVGAGFTPAQINNAIKNQNHNSKELYFRSTARVAPTVSEIVGAYKSLVANSCLSIYKSKNEIMGKFWHRNYYDHIIRNEKSHHTISNYIINNPSKWEDDKFYIL